MQLPVTSGILYYDLVCTNPAYYILLIACELGCCHGLNSSTQEYINAITGSAL